MLYERWRQIVREFRDEIALRDLPSARAWTFAQMDDAAREREFPDAVVFPRGNNADFVLNVLRAWRHGQAVCPLEISQSPPPLRPLPAGIAHLKTTSATTGAPKLIAFTAAQLAADAENIVATMRLQRDWPNLAFISLAHSYGFSNLITPLLLHGIPLILGGAPLPEMLRSAGRRFLALTLPAVPALWRVWADAKVIPGSVRLAISAGAPLPLALEQKIFEEVNLKIHNFYGASECGGIAYDDSHTPRSDGASVGTPMHNVELAINRAGCLEVHGRNVAESYFPEPSPALSQGVYATTDLAEIKDDHVFLRGRASEVINVAGRKVSPESIERILATHPAVSECVVFGVPSNELERGEMIVACVIRRNGASSEELRQFLSTQCESWQAPREFWFVESLEVNERGKVSRAEWRARFLGRHGEAGRHPK